MLHSQYVCPASDEECDGHVVHVEEFFVVEYFPVAHTVQSEIVPDIPAGQASLHSSLLLLPGAESDLSAGQSRHALDEVAATAPEYLPIVHLVQSLSTT